MGSRCPPGSIEAVIKVRTLARYVWHHPRDTIGYILGFATVLAVLTFVALFAVSAVDAFDMRIHSYSTTR